MKHLTVLWIAIGVQGLFGEIMVSPSSVQRGETFNFAVEATGCPAAGIVPPYSLDVSGSGITLNQPSAKPTNCSLTISATVSPDAAFGTRDVFVYDKDKTTLLGSAKLEVADLQARPIPPGLAPQVDVMWNVMSERGCSDEFGDRVARNYYCLEVQIGNNSGYGLLISGIGFLRDAPGFNYREANSTYHQVRSVLQREQVVSGRNITLRSLQAAGVVIAGFAPFAANAGPRGRIGLWSSFVGNVLAGAYDGLIPDRTVRQLGNLDDAALRDGKLIPNNSPVKFTVFTDRESIVPFLSGSACYAAYTLHQMQKEYNRTKFDYELAVKTKSQVKQLDALKAAMDKLTLGIEQAKRMLDVNTRDGCSGGKPPRVGHGLNPLGRGRALQEEDLVAVRHALGTVIIVGDQIEYKQRIQVDSSANVAEAKPNPIISGILSGAATQDKAVTLTLTGRWLNGAVATPLNCTNTTFTASTDSTGVALTLKDFKVPADCPDAAIQLLVATGASSPVQFAIPVSAQPPTITPPVQVSPATIVDGLAQTVTLSVTGTYLAGASAAVVVKVEGAAVPTNPIATVTPDAVNKATQLTVAVPLSAAQAKDGATLDLTLTTRGGAVSAPTITLKK